MAPWGDSKLFFCFCLVFITCCCTVADAQIPMDCCLSVRNKRIDRRRIVDYGQQIRGHGCSIDATILLTRVGRTLCVPANEPWVQMVMSYVDGQKKKGCRGGCKNERRVKRMHA